MVFLFQTVLFLARSFSQYLSEKIGKILKKKLLASDFKNKDSTVLFS